MRIWRSARCVRWPARLTIALLLAGLPPTSAGDDLRDLVEEVLDQNAREISILGEPIRAALSQLGEQSGLRFVLDESAVHWMPYGERTRVSLVIDGITLRQGLRQMFDGLGLAMRTVDDKVRVEPAPVLDRLGRRLSYDEMRLLQNLAAKNWAELEEASKVVQFRGLTGSDLRPSLEAAIAQVQAPNALRELEAATESLGWHWIPQGQMIVAYSRTEDVWYRLQREVDLNYQNAPLDDVLIDLGNRVGVTVLFEAGVLDRIQAQNRTIDLIHPRTTPLQTFERICGATGTCFDVLEHGVLIGRPGDETGATDAATPARRGTARVVAVLRVPVGQDGTTVEFPFYEDTVPPEFLRLLDQKLPVVLDGLRRGGN